jgi:hypothetical protein
VSVSVVIGCPLSLSEKVGRSAARLEAFGPMAR